MSTDKLDKGSKARSTNMRYISLICLTLQTTSIIILYSYSRILPKGAVRYLSSTVVVIAEILKLIFCLAIIFKDSGESRLGILQSADYGTLLTYHNYHHSYRLLSFKMSQHVEQRNYIQFRRKHQSFSARRPICFAKQSCLLRLDKSRSGNLSSRISA